MWPSEGAAPAPEQIRIVGARQHNLKNLSLTLPRRAITAFTGVSGSGKTSLVFDTIVAEAQRQVNETYTAFVRNRMPSYGRPDVDSLENLSPVVVIDQRRLGGNARSTVGTITDIYTLLRLLFSRAGDPQVGESFPTGVLTVVTGVAGSGKSSLVGVMLDQHPGGTVVDQAAVSTSRRSNAATYTGIAGPIRQLFAEANGVSASLFSANSHGACPTCRGLGVVYTPTWLSWVATPRCARPATVGASPRRCSNTPWTVAL